LKKIKHKDKMKFLYLTIISIFFVACQSNEVKVPVNDNAGIPEVWDNSPVYILMNIKDGDTLAEAKLGQTVSTTKWLVAVDKRLTLKQLEPALQKVLKKRHKKSMHSDGKGKLYFTYLDSLQNKISFVEASQMQMMPDFYRSKTYFKEYPQADKEFDKWHLLVTPAQFIINDSIILPTNTVKKDLLKHLNDLGTPTENSRPKKLYLNFDNRLTFDRFLDIYTYFKNHQIKGVGVSPKIFIFTP